MFPIFFPILSSRTDKSALSFPRGYHLGRCGAIAIRDPILESRDNTRTKVLGGASDSDEGQANCTLRDTSARRARSRGLHAVTLPLALRKACSSWEPACLRQRRWGAAKVQPIGSLLGWPSLQILHGSSVAQFLVRAEVDQGSSKPARLDERGCVRNRSRQRSRSEVDVVVFDKHDVTEGGCGAGKYR